MEPMETQGERGPEGENHLFVNTKSWVATVTRGSSWQPLSPLHVCVCVCEPWGCLSVWLHSYRPHSSPCAQPATYHSIFPSRQHRQHKAARFVSDRKPWWRDVDNIMMYSMMKWKKCCMERKLWCIRGEITKPRLKITLFKNVTQIWSITHL